MTVPDADGIARALSCEQRGCPCIRPGDKRHCPVHDHADVTEEEKGGPK